MTARARCPRRELLVTAGVAGFGLVCAPRHGTAADVPRAPRPTPPYRVWFQPRLFHRDMDLYRHMTIDASGWLDPRICAAANVTGLRWVYGTNHPETPPADYWVREAAMATRSVPQDAPRLVAAGIAIDEWVTPRQPEIEDRIATGLRAAKASDPELFVAVWYTDLRSTLVELVRDGTVDLVIIEGYTHTPERFGPDASLHWSTCLRRCDAAVDEGILDRAIFCFGHVTDEPHRDGSILHGEWLTERAEEIRDRYAAMPGVAYYQSDSPDSPELRGLVRHCDMLAGRLWP